MLIDYVSSAMDEEDFRKLFKNSPKMPGQQAQKFNRLMIQGFAQNGIRVHAITGRPITGANFNGKFLGNARTEKGGISWIYESVLNFPVIKNIWQLITTYITVLRESKYGNNVIFLDVLNASIAYGAVLAAKRRKRPCIGVVTDLPELMVTGSKRFHVKLVHMVIKHCTGFVFLTEAMNNILNTEHKPYIVIEALCDYNMIIAERKTDKTRRSCMYAGLLDARYGVRSMVEGFIKADVPNVELHIFGDGPYAKELQEYTKLYSNIKYFGSVMNDIIVKKELAATLLVNPRPTQEVFTKYSFPSKNIEYMASGTPVLTTALPGMPNEYKDFLYLIEKEDPDGIAEAFKKVLNLPENELWQKGKEAKNFVMTKKNNITQTQKVIRFIELLK